jgi:hypothetical protein
MTIEKYRQYRRLLKTTPFNGMFVQYDWGALPRPLHVSWMAYSQMLDEFSRELANTLNTLTRYTHQLAAWRDLLAPMGEQQQLNTAVEFIDPMATVAVNLPYVIRSRFIFAAAHLCHQANRIKQESAWRDEFPLDDEVWFEAADKYGKGWKRYNNFKARLEKIGAKDYQHGTHNFRNAYNHRFSPQIVLGISRVVTRSVDNVNGSVSYAFGGTPALTLPRVVSLLEEQCQRCYRAFDAFQQLIREHEAGISVNNAALLEVAKQTPTINNQKVRPRQ